MSSSEQKQNQKKMAASSPKIEIEIRPQTKPINEDTKQNEEQEMKYFTYAMQLATSSVLPMALQTAMELGIFEIIARGGPGAKLCSSEIVARMPTRNKDAPVMVDRLLRVLVVGGVIECSTDLNDDDIRLTKRVYSLTPVSKYFVKNEEGVSLSPLMSLVQDKVFFDSWSQLKDAILEGGSAFNRVHGSHVYEYLSNNSRFSQVFSTAMFNHTTLVVKKILESYNGFENLKQLVDVGGGIGVAVSLITSKYPSINCINFDLPRVIEHAPPYPGVKHVGGDMFESVPKGDAILLKWVLHDWSDEQCIKLLKNCYDSTPANGKVIVVEQVLPIFNVYTTVEQAKCQMDVLMMTQSPGGKERMQNEFISLALGAGFKSFSFASYAYHYWVLEFLK